MADLRTELEQYASADEPPMRMTFDEVLTTARRKRQRRRSLIIAGGAAVLAAVAIMVPTVFTTSAQDTPPAAPPVLRTDCPAVPDKRAQIECAVNKFLTTQLPDMQRQPLQITNRDSDWNVSAWMKDTYGSVRVMISPDAPKQTCESGELPDMTCEQRVGPHGERVLVLTTPSTDDPSGIAIGVFSVTDRAVISVGTSQSTATRLLTVDQMITLATTPELIP